MRDHLEKLRSDAPYSMEELVKAANRILLDSRHAEVGTRTVRYYVSERLLPPPLGSPKLARYTFEHLLRLVSARALQDSGLKLDAIAAALDGAAAQGEDEFTRTARSWLSKAELVQPLRLHEQYFASPERDLIEPKLARERYRKLRLTPNSELHVREGAKMDSELAKVVEKLNKLIEKNRKGS